MATTHPSSEQLVDEHRNATPPAAPAAPARPGTPELPEAGLGPQITPWAVMGALLVAAGAVRIAQHAATGADAEIAYGVAAVAFTTAVVAASVTRRKLPKLSREQRHRLVAALYLGAAWLSSVAFAGLSWGAVTALGLLGCGVSLLWWREHRIGPGLDPGTLPNVDDGDMFIDRWRQHLGGKGKPFAGSKLHSPQIIKSGYRYVLELVPATQSVDQVIGAVNALRGGLRLMPGQDVIVEEHPTEAAPTALLTIVTRPIITRPRLWPGPEAGFDSKTGSVRLGPFSDGEGVACWRVYTKDSMWGGFIQGGTGSGKSRFLEQIAMSCAASTSHPTVVWYGDGQNGDSSPLLVKHADYAATTFSEIYNMTQAGLRVMKINGVENRLAGQVGFTPTAARPGTLIMVDEFHKALDAKQNPLLATATQSAFATIAREGRKNGVALILATQSPTLDAFGGSGNGNLGDTLRQSVLAGNGLILRSKTGNAKQVFGVDINPRKFPKLPGYGFLCDPEPGARSAPFRGYWIDDELAESWPGRIAWRSLPNRQANMAGKHYARRHEIAAEQRFNDEMLLAMADAGSLDDLEDLENSMAAAAAAAGVPDVIDLGDGHPPIRRVEKFWERPAPAGPTADADAGSELSDGQQRVLNAILAGTRQPKDLMTATGYSSSRVYQLLGELVEGGHIHKARYGSYDAGSAPAA